MIEYVTLFVLGWDNIISSIESLGKSLLNGYNEVEAAIENNVCIEKVHDIFSEGIEVPDIRTWNEEFFTKIINPFVKGVSTNQDILSSFFQVFRTSLA